MLLTTSWSIPWLVREASEDIITRLNDSKRKLFIVTVLVKSGRLKAIILSMETSLPLCSLNRGPLYPLQELLQVSAVAANNGRRLKTFPMLTWGLDIMKRKIGLINTGMTITQSTL